MERVDNTHISLLPYITSPLGEETLDDRQHRGQRHKDETGHLLLKVDDDDDDDDGFTVDCYK